MIMPWIYVVLGLAILLFAGDFLVKGAVNLATRLGIPALVVSLTIVAFGTSAPELIIVLSAIYENAPTLAVGNVVGSNTANVLLVLGVPAILAGLDTREVDTKRSFMLMIAATVLFIALAFTGAFIWWHGLILLAVLAFMLFDQARSGAVDEEVEGLDASISRAKITVYLVLGMIGLPIGAELLVRNSVLIATDFGLSEAVIGLTLVAIGTSLPELATTVMAAYRRQADVALGNVIGSNMFNLLGIVGVGALFGKLPIPHPFLNLDLWVMLGASLLLIPFVYFRQVIGRAWGVVLILLYAAYLWTILA